MRSRSFAALRAASSFSGVDRDAPPLDSREDANFLAAELFLSCASSSFTLLNRTEPGVPPAEDMPNLFQVLMIATRFGDFERAPGDRRGLLLPCDDYT
mmetsp:Transcript_35030/g.104471  ORF Transcript_35030/g.104471 Transcript_35030/m.104471 type:complete len:98 (-) Transcript_35030:59-352(-)